MIKLYIGLVVVVLIAGGMGYRSCKRQWEAEQALKAQAEVQEETKEVQDEQEKRKQKVERMAPRELLDYWHGMQHDSSGSRKAPAPGPAPPGKH